MSQPIRATPDRVRIAYTIIGCHLALIGTVAFLYISDSLLTEEFTPLMTLLAPVTALYAGTVFRYLAGSIKAGASAPATESPIAHASLVRRLIAAHFVLMFSLLAAKAMFNWIEFPVMVTLMALLESSFGGYMGAVLGAVFGEK